MAIIIVNFVPLGQVGFPLFLQLRYHNQGSPLKKQIYCYQIYDLITTQCTLQSYFDTHSRRFPHQYLLLILFCSNSFRKLFQIILAIDYLAVFHPKLPLKTSYAIHNFRHEIGLILSRSKSIRIYRIGLPQDQVSTNVGSESYAIMSAQHSILPALTPNWA